MKLVVVFFPSIDRELIRLAERNGSDSVFEGCCKGVI